MTIDQLVNWPFNFFELKAYLHSTKCGTFSIIDNSTYTQRNAIASEISNSCVCNQNVNIKYF